MPHVQPRADCAPKQKMSVKQLLPLEPHVAPCERNNENIQRYLDQLEAILEPYNTNTSSTTPIRVFADRLPRAVALLRSSELFQRYEFGSIDDEAMERLAERSTELLEAMPCVGCASQLAAYLGAVGFVVEVLRESIRIAPQPDKGDDALAERASALVEELQPTVLNIAMHWEELME